jgi:hypothetical protein
MVRTPNKKETRLETIFSPPNNLNMERDAVDYFKVDSARLFLYFFTSWVVIRSMAALMETLFPIVINHRYVKIPRIE